MQHTTVSDQEKKCIYGVYDQEGRTECLTVWPIKNTDSFPHPPLNLRMQAYNFCLNTGNCEGLDQKVAD